MMEHNTPLESRGDRPFVPLPHHVFEQPMSGAAGIVPQGEITVPGANGSESTDSPLPSPAAEASDITEVQPVTDVQSQNFESQTSTQEEAWHAESDIFDDLRVEAAMENPQLQEDALYYAGEYMDEYVTKYGHLMPEETIVAGQELSKRAMVMDRETFDTFYTEWTGQPEVEAQVRGIYYNEGDFVAINDPSVVWDGLSSEDKQAFTERFGSEEAAHRLADDITLSGDVGHEICHGLQDKSLSSLFGETGVRYYAEDASKSLGLSRWQEELNTQSVEYYEKMIDRYGNDVHRVFFGTMDNLERRAQIVGEFTPEKLAGVYDDASLAVYNTHPKNEK